MNLLDVLKSTPEYPIIFLLGALCHFGATYLIPAYLKFFYDRRIELDKRRLLRADKTAVIADLVSLLTKSGLTEDDKVKVNKYILEICLYLPNCLLFKLTHTACHSGGPEDIGWKELYAQIRGFIDGTYKPDKTKAKEIILGEHIALLLNEIPPSSNSSQTNNKINIDIRTGTGIEVRVTQEK